MLETGDRAPAFHLTDQDETKHRLSEFKGRRVLLFFYPKANTGGCTNQACGLRDIAGAIGDVQVLGISPDDPPAQKRWDDKHGFGFPLLSDPDHKVAEKYGVWAKKKLYGKEYMGIVRSAFLIGANGKIEHAWYKISPKATPEKLLEALEAADAEHPSPAELIPHRAPFLFVDEIIDLEPGVSCTARWNLTGEEPFFAGHFPGLPTLPGVLMVEALAQTAGLAAPRTEAFADKILMFGGIDKARFRRQVVPGDSLTLEATLGRMSSRGEVQRPGPRGRRGGVQG